jgi:nucleotide-binding universal stress UspA family protein
LIRERRDGRGPVVGDLAWQQINGGDMKILLAYDGFEHSRHALEEAAELANGGDVKIVSVVPEADARASKAGGHRWLAPHAHHDVAIAHRFLAERGIDSDMKIAYGDPATEIRKEAAAGEFDVIIVGSRDQRALGRLLLGSVSKALLEEAPCPVLVAGKNATIRRESTALVS